MSATVESSRKLSTTERRPSMAERRPSMPAGRRPSVIPHLAGIEEPALPTTPDQCDVLICGTGLVESVLAAALSWQGSNVLHVDSNPYYGDTSSTLTIEQIKAWCHNVNINTAGFRGYSKALLYIPRPDQLNSRDYSIDLTPRVMFARSDLLSLLLKSRVYRYLEFQSLSSFHTFENDSFGKMSSSKEEIFTDQSLSLETKRHLMKFMKLVLESDSPKSVKELEAYKTTPFTEFIEAKYKLTPAQVNELCFTLGLSPIPNILTPEGLSRIRRYLTSFSVYGTFPVLYSKFGGPGEISQGFCRSAAVAGATYKLDSQLQSYDSKKKIATFTDGSTVKVTERLVCSPSQAPANAENVPDKQYEITRLITIVSKSCKEWFSEGESAAVVVFPPNSLPSANAFPVQVIIMGSGSGCCPNGQCIWYLSTVEKGDKARHDLETALLKLEESILRESEDGGFDVDLTDDDVVVRPDGNVSVINSVKLGKSFKEFVPKEKLTFLFKLMFTQFTSVEPFGVVNENIFKNALNQGSENSVDHEVLYSNMPSAEVSYDGIVTEAKLLYTSIVGSDDDFFDVDFEDDDEDPLAGTQNDSAIVDEDDEEFKDEMDFEL
ncbi:hypothetical protein OGAPHI_007417 [Ogataea philodendri]|uniref:Rab proteins geranylgeranyltransferase n=1 Tax=Ogataea philodendri TaxID=1378263 RepID=A0A9P8NV44_9ASCO|nr:uncharacterized protein OGAPHI_007417 [Ogataea philodendri]KAH3660212.1 hypothetical protein OGAPHI_007417 [Ogataea philodendri]